MTFRRWSLRKRILLVAALPTIAAVVILSAFYMFQRWQDVRSNQEALSDLLLHNLAAAAEYPIVSGNYELLTPLIKSALQQPGVVAVEIRAPGGDSLLRRQDALYDEIPADDLSVRQFDMRRELQVLDEFSEFESEAASEKRSEVFATIHLSLADTFTRERELSIMWQSLLAGFLVVLVGAVVARLTAFDIIASLERLSSFFAQLARGENHARLKVDNGAEVGRLQLNANQLASSLQQAEAEQQQFTERILEEQQKTQLASRAKSEFLAMMSHELRTPLNGAIGMLQLMEPGLNEKEFRDFKGMAEHSLSHLTQLLEDVLVVVDTEKNKLQVRFSDHYIEDVLHDMMQSYASSAIHRGLSLVVDYGRDLKKQPIRTDPALIRQVIRHLIDNAMKFTTDGVVVVELDLMHGEAAERLRIQVADTGIGIADDQKEKVLEAFSQVSSSFNRRYDGIGLGLTITHHISHILGGSLKLEDNPGGGTRVVVELPVEIGKPPVIHSSDTVTEWNVLIVEDNQVNLKVAEKMLRKSFQGIGVDAVESGEACLLKAEQQRYDLILMDCQMPGLDGFETTRRLRESGINTPVIACTANTTDQVYQKCMDSGMNDYIAKPLKVDIIRKTLQRWLAANS